MAQGASYDRTYVSVRSKVSSKIREVAERAGVSISTVSRVLSGHPHVSADVRSRVEKAARALDYSPNRMARALRSRATRTIGVVVPDITNPFFTSVIEGIDTILYNRGYSLVLTNSNEDAAREKANLKTLEAERVAGVIFTPSAPGDSAYRRMIQQGTPLVAISRLPAGCSVDFVTADNVGGAAQAVGHLIGLGHRRIAFINGPLWSSSVRERQAGYEMAFLDAGLQTPAGLVIHSDLRQTGGYEAMRQVLGWTEKPTAVFVGNNLMTLGALQAIHERGLQIPSDIAVVGFDDLPWAKSLQPPLTAVALPTFDMGRTAAELLFERLSDAARPIRRVTLATQLVIRGSCGLCASQGARSGT